MVVLAIWLVPTSIPLVTVPAKLPIGGNPLTVHVAPTRN